MKKTYPTYKKTEIPWAEAIPSDWDIEKGKWLFQKENRPVREEDEVVTAFRDGEVTLRKNRREDGFTFSLKEIGYQGIRKGDLVIHGMDAFAGAIGVSDSDGKSSPVYNACTLRQEGEPWYFCHAVREMSRSGYIQSLAKGIRERSTDFRFDTFGEQLLPVPSFSEQRQIAAYLDHKCALIDTFIAKKKRLIELLQEQKQAIINQAVTRGIDPEAPLKPSGVDWLGDIPAHWEVKKLKYYFSIRSGQVDPKEDDYKDLVLIAPNHIESNTGKLLFQETAIEQGAESGKYEVQSGEIIYSKIRPELRKACISEDYCLCSADMYPIQPSKEILPKFFLFMILGNSFSRYMEELSMRVAMPKVNREDLNNYIFTLPPLNEQVDIVDYIEKEKANIDLTIERLEKELTLIQEYKTTLIAEAVTGKIDVRDWKPEKAADISEGLKTALS